ncbi:MAG: DUF4919 domain-containing protein [Bacteroidetes bacterium]|nr:DUF4919 domain-containing protein [Bacteroidota bacterium]MCB9226592.1 DUF4919 domain-containing protein [Chitinophagales bacterium]
MKRLFNILLLFFSIAFANAQVYIYGISLEELKGEVLNNKHVIVETNQRCINLDTTVNIRDLFLLYFGSAFYDNYNPYAESLAYSIIESLYEEKKFKEVIEECNNIIKDNPGIIKPFSYIGEAYYQLGDSAKARLAYTVYYNLLSLPFYSGNGTCYDSAFVVRSISDEYTIMHELGLNSIGQSLNYNNNIPFDILYTQNAEDNEEETGYYFNIYLPFSIGLKEILKSDSKEKKKRKNKKL